MIAGRNTLWPSERPGPAGGFEHTMLAEDRYGVDHQRTTCHGVDLSDTSYRGGNEIRVALRGEYILLKAEDALELAAALRNIAQAQIERVFREEHRRFLINHPGEGVRDPLAYAPALARDTFRLSFQRPQGAWIRACNDGSWHTLGGALLTAHHRFQDAGRAA